MTKSHAGQPASKVKVAVRVRPFNKREIDLNTQCVVDMRGEQTFLTPPGAIGKQHEKKQTKMFSFDHCFWSMDASQEDKFADQEEVFKNLGIELLDNAFSGYNACIFAYGQTGSGKSYTMMGGGDQAGLIPRLCNVLFERIVNDASADKSFKVEVSYMEIYNEKVRDLLDPSGGRHQLRVREHKLLGPYVDGLQQLVASSAEEVQGLMSEGSKSRTVAATKMNAESSRSHAVFTLIVTHSISDERSGISGERVSKLSLVDLAGSERSSKTGASGARLKEGSNINKSLTTLGLVISALADQSAGKTKNKFVPYRDSTLTWILKDNLGGNSRTTMVATLSPSADNYEETLSTLRYADRAKRIVNKAVVNEDPNARIIRELREEVEKLQTQLKQSESMRAPGLHDKLAESEKLMKEISLTWEEKLRLTELAHKKRQETLEKMGISLKTSGIKLEKAKCFLVNLNADPSLNELLVYYLKDNTLVGQSDQSDIQLSGLGINQNHAEVSICQDDSGALVNVTPLEGARTCVNGQPISKPCRLRHGDRILWGNNHFFRVNIPRSARRKEAMSIQTDTDQDHKEDNTNDMDTSLNDTPPVSYEFAQQEVLFNQVEAPIQETIMNMEREFQLLQDETTQAAPGSINKSMSKLDEEERKKYESEIDSLRKQLLSLTPSPSQDSLDQESGQSPQKTPQTKSDSPTPGYQKYKTMKDEREIVFRTSISRLRTELVRAQALSREANDIAKELHKNTEFAVTLRIPAHSLTPNRKKGTLLCEPAIHVILQGKDCLVWSVEKLSNRLVDMRDLYQLHQFTKNSLNPNGSQNPDHMNQSLTDEIKDPFNESDHGQSLIGVANVFLTCLIQDAPLYYPVPIINQQGQVAGKLLVGLQKISGSIPDYMLSGEFEERSSESGSGLESEDSSCTCGVSSGSESSSGVGSSLSPDPPTDSSKLPDQKILDTSSTSYPTTLPLDMSEDKPRYRDTPQLTCRLTILEAQGLPPTFSHFVECQYTFFDYPDVTKVPPEISPDEVSPQRRSSLEIRFNHAMIFTCNVTEELVDRLTSNASLPIEVWGHRDRYHNIERTPSQLSRHSHSPPGAIRSRGRTSRKSRSSRARGASLLSEKSRSLKERWSEVMKRLQMEVTIQELGETGDYEPVEITNKVDVPSVGIFQLKQGQSRRINISVSPVPRSGTLPLICDNIAAVYVGSICARTINKERGLDSYQDHDLNVLREKWDLILDERKSHLDKQIKILAAKENKTNLEKERENRLFDQWVMLTEERNAVSAPTPSSGVPGAPASWNPPASYEMHVPIVFLNLESGPVGCDDVIRCPAGLDSVLPLESPETFVHLPFVRPPHADFRGHVSSLVSWDSSMHDSPLLNRVTPSGERIYLIIKVHIRLSHPLEMDLVLRKRVCVSVYKQKGITAVIMRKMQGKPLSSSGVVYEIVSNVSPTSSEGEDQETLAMLAASGANDPIEADEDSSDADDSIDENADKESHFVKYVMQATRSVDNILALDRIRQEVALRDALVRDPNPSDSRTKGADVMSILSKRNKSKASSSSSAYSAVQRRSWRTSATDSKFNVARQFFRVTSSRISPSPIQSALSASTDSIADLNHQERKVFPLQRSLSAVNVTKSPSEIHNEPPSKSPKKKLKLIPPKFHSTPVKQKVVVKAVPDTLEDVEASQDFSNFFYNS